MVQDTLPSSKNDRTSLNPNNTEDEKLVEILGWGGGGGTPYTHNFGNINIYVLT